MLRKEKMKGERETDNFSGENFHLTTRNHHHCYNQQLMFESGVSSSSSYASGFCFPDVASSSVSPFDHAGYPTPKTHFVDQIFLGSNSPDSYYRRANNGVMMDELGLTREFQKMDIGNRVSDVSSNTGQFHRDPGLFRMGDCNVAEIRPSIDENFGVLEGFMNGFSGSGGFSSLYGDERSVKDERNFRFGQRGVSNLGNSLGSNSPYAVHGQQNCLINFPLDGTTHQGDEFYENGVSLLKGDPFYDRMPVYESNGFVGNGSVPRAVAGEYISNGGVIPRGDAAYGNEIPFPIESTYGPHTGPYMMDGCTDMLNPWGSSQNLSMYQHILANEAAFLEQYGRQFSGNVGGLNSVDASQIVYSNQALGRGNNSVREKTRAVEQRQGISPGALVKRTKHLEQYGCESRIIPDKGPNGVMGKSKNYQYAGHTKKFSGNSLQNLGERNIELNVPLQSERACENGGCTIDYDQLFMPTSFNSVADVRGSIFLMAKDQHGCRLLQKKFDEGSFEDVKLIFNEVIDHVVELMINQFGNYLVQKLLNVCNEEQKMKIVHVVTKNRGELVKISLNSYGTRVVQKLIESLETRKQISLVIKALEPGFLSLMTDLNGNHVVQRCLQCLSNEDNKFIFDAAARHCVEIATHRHGCCVLQRCIDHSTGEYWLKLIDRICSNALVLAQDPFGNYVVQYVIEMKIPSMRSKLISQFEGNFVLLSTQKFSSHVVEKCLKCIEETHPRIVRELLSVPHFEQLVQDPFANYVLQSALEETKGTIYDSLVAALRPHSMLRTNPYCKKIFSRGLLKK